MIFSFRSTDFDIFSGDITITSLRNACNSGTEYVSEYYKIRITMDPQNISEQSNTGGCRYQNPELANSPTINTKECFNEEPRAGPLPWLYINDKQIRRHRLKPCRLQAFPYIGMDELSSMQFLARFPQRRLVYIHGLGKVRLNQSHQLWILRILESVIFALMS